MLHRFGGGEAATNQAIESFNASEEDNVYGPWDIKSKVAAVAVILALGAFCFFCTYNSHAIQANRRMYWARRFLGSKEGVVVRLMGAPQEIITSEDIRLGRSVFPPRATEFEELHEVTGKVLVYRDSAIGLLFVFIDVSGRVEFVTRTAPNYGR